MHSSKKKCFYDGNRQKCVCDNSLLFPLTASSTISPHEDAFSRPLSKFALIGEINGFSADFWDEGGDIRE